ncbi:MAG: hypothetical protein AAGU27_26280 [Dehalobacterium sp.]
MIAAAYAGCGKYTFAAMHGESAIDLHCIPYKYYLDKNNDRGEAGKADPDNEMRPEWPHNYVSAIENVMDNYDYVLIPSDFHVLTLLAEKQIRYTLIYPHRDAREEYLSRYTNRGNTKNFLSIFYEHWDWFIDNLEADSFGKHIALQPHQFFG